ncbi:hypothetical protein RintRC_6527 [Richelia intracellularis]|nr:hypothetical protein RintRC_6527 [Richelia intracellularis]
MNLRHHRWKQNLLDLNILPTPIHQSQIEKSATLLVRRRVKLRQVLEEVEG